MGLTPNFTPQQFKAAVQKRMDRIEAVIIRRFQYLGEQCVNEARNSGNYTDRTGNLRSSTGYVVYANGRLVETGGFEQVKYGEEGARKGKQFAMKIAQEYSKNGFLLLVVAGMSYGFHVETRGYDVLASAEHLAERSMDGIKRKILKQIKAMK